MTGRTKVTAKPPPKSQITCHVLDSSIGKPAQGIKVQLLAPNIQESGQAHAGTQWGRIGTSVTNADGRCLDLLIPRESSPHKVKPGTYQIVFETEEYFERTGRKSFYPFVQITFKIGDTSEHYHVPLLISPFSYTTYRGS